MKEIKRKQDQLVCRGNKVHIFQDLCNETLNWRKSMKPVTAVLIKNNFKYQWGHRIYIFWKIWKDRVLFKIYSCDEGKERLKAWKQWKEEESQEITPTSSNNIES